MHEELVQIREPAHPPDREVATRPGPDTRDENPGGAVPPRHPAAVGEPGPTGGDEGGGGGEVGRFGEDGEARGVGGWSRGQESRRVRSEFVEQIAELLALEM